MIQDQAQSFNARTKLVKTKDHGSYITLKNSYDRNHGPIPLLNAAKHVVQVDGAVVTPCSLTINQLRNDFRQHEIICALQCAGNRRHTMRTMIKEVQGINWLNGAVMNCIWKGPRLRDIITQAGVHSMMMDESTNRYLGYAAFACDEQEVQEDSWYGGAIELERAMHLEGDVMLALEMNGEPLTAEHGAPVRIIVPGVAGARSVKWLSRITLQLKDSENFYQQHDYKILPPEATDMETANRYWKKVPPLMDMPVNSIIGIPGDGEIVESKPDGLVEVRGYALPNGGDGPVERVEVSGDGGITWSEALLDYGGYGDLSREESKKKLKWAWCLWSAKIKLNKGKGQRIVSRATDCGGNIQEEQSPWNLRGVAYNGWGEVHDLTII